MSTVLVAMSTTLARKRTMMAESESENCACVAMMEVMLALEGPQEENVCCMRIYAGWIEGQKEQIREYALNDEIKWFLVPSNYS